MGYKVYTQDKIDNLLDEKLSLSGGTMTGTITVSIPSGHAFAVSSTNSNYITVCGGSDALSGAVLILSGADNTSLPGGFTLSARSGTFYSSLIGQPNGVLTWNNKNVITAEGGTNHGIMEGSFAEKVITIAVSATGILESKTITINPEEGNIFDITIAGAPTSVAINFNTFIDGQVIKLLIHGNNSFGLCTLSFSPTVKWITGYTPTLPDSDTHYALIRIISINNVLYGNAIQYDIGSELAPLDIPEFNPI